MGILDLSADQRRGRAHYVIRVGELTLAYAYIRKNACSTFKQVFIGLSLHSWNTGTETELEFMNSHHRAKRHQIATADYRICILRDPVERAVSTYRNKFIQRSYHGGIFASYEKITGQNPEEASFADFVQRYLTQPPVLLDQHVLPQAAHLRPFSYNATFLIEGLHDGMARIIGPDLARTYFRDRQNPSGGRELQDSGAADRPSRVLAQAFLAEDRQIPDKDSFLTPDLRALLARYAEDSVLLARITPAPPPPRCSHRPPVIPAD